MKTIEVAVADHGYQIHIADNLLDQIGDIIKPFCGEKVLVITDDNLAALYGKQVVENLRAARLKTELFSVKPGEEAKSLGTAGEIYSCAIRFGLDRTSAIIALGGGVVGDLAGFVAATFLRGIPFIQVPGSLLAQVDSSVGGKVAVNHPLGKNLIGAFYQPKTVIADLKVLNTLPDRELSAGLAEVIKYGIIADKSLFEYLAINYGKILQRDSEALEFIIARSCRIKAQVVGQDEREAGLRMILNYGHTIGHAVEAVTNFSRYNHGEAVAIGMCGAARLSYYRGLCKEDSWLAVRSLVKKFRLPTEATGCKASELLEFVKRDKKILNGKINWILLREIGKVEINNTIDWVAVQRVLQEITAD